MEQKREEKRSVREQACKYLQICAPSLQTSPLPFKDIPGFYLLIFYLFDVIHRIPLLTERIAVGVALSCFVVRHEFRSSVLSVNPISLAFENSLSSAFRSRSDVISSVKLQDAPFLRDALFRDLQLQEVGRRDGTIFFFETHKGLARACSDKAAGLAIQIEALLRDERARARARERGGERVFGSWNK